MQKWPYENQKLLLFILDCFEKDLKQLFTPKVWGFILREKKKYTYIIKS